MNMGGTSTSHSAVLRREDGGRPAYDLRSWQGLTDVLRLAKETLSPAEHASFRDLVLQYAQQGGDQELKAEIDAVIARLGAARTTPSVEDTTPEPASEPVPEPATTPAPARRPAVSQMRRPAPRFMPRSLTHEDTTVPPPPVEPVPEPTPAFEPPVVAEPVPAPAPEPASTSALRPTPEPVVESAPTSPRSLEEHKARIIEIKRLVNEQIGNPVALVGTHKEKGRTYMQALLTALKATGGGGTGVEAAMRSLEDAYGALLMDTPESEPAPTPAAPVPEPVVAAAEPPKAAVSPEPRPAPVARSMPTPRVSTPTPTTPRPVPEPPRPAAPESMRSVPVSIPVRQAAPKPEMKTEPSPVRPVPPSFSAAATHASLARPSVKPKEEPAVVPAAPEHAEAPQNGFTTTKYTQKKIGATSPRALAESGVDADRAAVRQSELVSPKITQALHDLLHEWNIFSSSGLFGTGPSGPEHPLYMKLAPLSMGEIITGRYEGADRQVNNVIHDYVNAWRHEQGVAYTPSETFEHYLRRVVQRIQKRNQSAR